MKKLFLTFILLFIFINIFSQRVYLTDNINETSYKMYVSNIETPNVRKVHIVTDTTEFIGLGNWYFVNDKKDADYVVYFTDKPNDSIPTIFFTEKSAYIYNKRKKITD
jgi:hypothetical protein